MSYYFNGITTLDRTSNYSPQGAVVQVTVDAGSDLPTVADIQTDYGYTPIIGSTAYVVGDSQTYMMDSSGTWILQQTSPYSDVYTEAETDALIAGLQTQIDGLNICSLTAIDENAARPYTIRDLDFGRWVRTQNMTQCTDPPSDLAGAYIVYVETARVTNSRKMIRLYPVTTGAATKWYLTVETGAGVWTNWYRFDGTDTGS